MSSKGCRYLLICPTVSGVLHVCCLIVDLVPHCLGEAWLHEVCCRPGMQRGHPIWFAWPVHAMHAPSPGAMHTLLIRFRNQSFAQGKVPACCCTGSFRMRLRSSCSCTHGQMCLVIGCTLFHPVNELFVFLQVIRAPAIQNVYGLMTRCLPKSKKLLRCSPVGCNIPISNCPNCCCNCEDQTKQISCRLCGVPLVLLSHPEL